MMKPKFILLVICAWCLVLPVPAVFSEEKADNAALVDLDGVFVKIVMDNKIIEHGVSLEEIEKDLKSKLTSAGIRILSLSELRETPGAPILIVEADCVKVESLSTKTKTLYSVVANLSLFQIVGTDSSKVPYGETTWDIEERGISFDLADIRLFLTKAVDGFLKSHRSANPNN